MRIFIVTSLLMLFSGCMDMDKKNEQADNNSNKDSELRRVKSFLALGDSYTIGESVGESERWPVQLTKRLVEDSIQISYPTIIATTGWTSDELIKGIEESELGGTFDLVSLLIGVNNQYRGWSLEQFRLEFIDLLDISKKFARQKKSNVIVLSIPDWGVMPFAKGRDTEKIAAEIDLFNKVILTECEKEGITYFDITEISRNAVTDQSLVAEDGLHPSGEMYSQWVNAIYQHVFELVK